ncbi:MAG TPA: hydratase [Pseudolabrys sp.]|jgi:2-keto-4-pentenoate hydratase
MTAQSFAAALAQARAEAKILGHAAWEGSARSVADAYAVQDELARGHAVRGWKVTALKPEQQRGYRADRPVAGALLAPFVHASPAALPLAAFITPLLECEVAFLLGADLPPRAAPYSRQEIEAAIEAVVPVMEVADGRFAPEAPDLLKLADDMGNGAFIVGGPFKDWRKLDLGQINVTLTLDDHETWQGESARILGNPLLAVIALANAQPLPAGGLKRGQIVTTGTCTTPIPPRAGEYVAQFDAIGSVSVRFL